MRNAAVRTICRSSRSGMTLVEILIAMVVLLVGIYTVARGFPLMLQSIRGEGERTSMTRLAENMLARLSDNQYGFPDAITGGGSTDNYSYPDDMTAPHVVPNSEEDIIEVRGETFRVPSPYHAPDNSTAADAPAVYPLGQGPAAWTSGYPYVYMLVPLEERPDDPRAAEAVEVPGNWFYVDKQNGEIVVPVTITTSDGVQTRSWTTSNVVADYAWTIPSPGAAEERPVVHYVQNETPSDVSDWPSSGTAQFRVSKVHPAHLSGGGCLLMAGSTRAWARINFSREPFGVASPHASGYYVLENSFGATLKFHPADTGLTLKTDYQLATSKIPEDLNDPAAWPRRLLVMTEEQTIQSKASRTNASGVPYLDVRLAVRNLDAEPLFANDLNGAPLPSPVHVLAVDLTTGQTYTDGSPIVLDDRSLEPPLENGYQNGVLSIPLQVSGNPADYIGHVWRFYYRTLDRHNVQMQCAPRAYVDAETARSYLQAYLPTGEDEAESLANVDFRTYRLRLEDIPGGMQAGIIEFGQWLTGETWATAESTSGMTLAVNYAYWPDAQHRKVVYGELHTVSIGGREIMLNHATTSNYPIEVMAVNGVSARARAWWLTRTGKQKLLDVETVLLPDTLGQLPKVR